MQFLGSLFQNLATVAGTTNSYSYSYTQSPSGLVLVVVTTSTGGSTSSVTFDGEAMTQAISYTGPTSGVTFKLFYYFTALSRASGSYNVDIVNSTTGLSTDMWIGEYEGVKNDFSNFTTSAPSFTASPIVFNETTVADDSWLFAFGRFSALLRTANGSSDGTLRSPTGFSRAWVDSGASEGTAGAKSINITSGSSPSGVVENFVIELKRETNFTLGVTESATAADGIGSRAGTRNVQESETFLDVGRKVLARVLVEVGTFADTLFAQVSKIFTETSTITDTLRRLITRAPRETFTATERITRALTVRFSELGRFIDTGRLSGVWIPRTPPNTSWSNASPPSSSWTDRTEPSSSFTPRTPPSSSWTDRTKPPTTWS